PVSTNFCATATPALASHWSSSETTSNFSVLPPTLILRAFNSSTARRTPLSLSRPAKVFGPDRGPLWPILTTCSCAVVAVAQASAARATRVDLNGETVIANAPVRVVSRKKGPGARAAVGQARPGAAVRLGTAGHYPCNQTEKRCLR